MLPSEGSRRRASGEERRFGVRANSTASENKAVSREPGSPQEEEVNALLARLNSAMNIEPTSLHSQDTSLSQLSPSTCNDLSSQLLDSSLSLNDQSDLSIQRKTSSVYSSSSTLQDAEDLEPCLERSVLDVDTPTPSHQASTSQDFTSDILDSTSKAETSTMAMVSSAEEASKPVTPSKREILPWYKKRKGKKPSKTEMDKWQMELDMWNAPDSTVLEHLLRNKGQVSKWQAVATARGLCSLSDNCRCPDCQSTYISFDNDGDGGMGAGAVMMAPACSIQ